MLRNSNVINSRIGGQYEYLECGWNLWWGVRMQSRRCKVRIAEPLTVLVRSTTVDNRQ